MNVLINLNSLTPPITGIGRYTAEILKYLIEDNNLVGFDSYQKYNHKQIQNKLQNIDALTVHKETFNAYIKNTLKNIPYAYQLRKKRQQQIINRLVMQDRSLIYWEPNYILQPFSGKTVASVHDLSHLKYPQYHSKATRQWLEQNLESTINRADALIALSKFSQAEIIKKFPEAKNKIKIISPAVADEFKTTINIETLDTIKAKYKLPAHYVLSVGTREPRKNLKTLLQAYSYLPQYLKNQAPLVIVGAKGWGEEEPLIQSMLSKQELIILGYIAQHDIPAIYQAADLFIYISLYEGYGMPVAEAMASGTAVITSKDSAMSEISGSLAKLVDPLNVQEITDAIKYCLENMDVQQDLASEGRHQMQKISWKASASALQTLFKQL